VRHVMVLAMLAVTLPMSSAASAAEPCPTVEQMGLVPGASQPGVSGVVERQVIASNPFPWGRSVSAVTRVWGGVIVERWHTSNRGDPCLDARLPVEVTSYATVGRTEIELNPVGHTISQLEEAALTARFGPAVPHEPSGLDRFMAWMRVFPSILVLLGLVGWGTVALFRLRRGRRPDPYLF
jgi:hypothetical protein